MASSFLQKLYNKLPVGLQNLAISAFGLKWYNRRLGGSFHRDVLAARARESYTASDWYNYQVNELRDLLLDAFRNVPYYRDQYTRAGIAEEQLRVFKPEDLNQLPMLSKDDLRRYGKSTLLSGKKERGEFYSSSGSTGTPTQIHFSVKTHRRWYALFEARVRNWAGITYRDARGMIGGRRILADGEGKPPYYRYNFIEKQVYFSAYHIAPKTVANYLKGMTDHHIQYMTGYAMSNYFLARFIEEQGLTAPALKAVITSSEKLTNEMRAVFKRVYGCHTYDSYSGLEACGLISECEQGKLHISPDAGIMEILKDDGTAAQPGETGEVVCTGLLNHDQPLIRYRIGDLIRLDANQQCSCGRQMPVVAEIIGRTEDTVVGKDGREMVRFHGILLDLPEVVEGQVIQHTLDGFEVVVVAIGKLSENSSAKIIQRMRSQLGDVNVKITQAEHIPRNQNGKFKAVISHVKQNARNTPA